MRNPKHILITGSSSGIGASLAKLYGHNGVRLSLHGRDLNRLTALSNELKEQGCNVTFFQGDVCDGEKMAFWINQCDALEPIDLIIANAGISAGKDGYGESDAQSREIFKINLEGVLNTVQPAIEIMKKRRHGQIAIMSSLAAFRGIPRAPSYTASKAAVRIYGEALRGEMGLHNISVNVICPGFIKTPMTDVNLFPMPFIMTAEKASLIIKKGLAANRARIAFPTFMYILVRVMAALPQSLIDAIILRLPKKAI